MKVLLARITKALSVSPFAAASPRNTFRRDWGKPGSKEGWLVSRYFELTRGQAGLPVVDDKTWADLEFPKLFQVMDSTITPIGSQVLFRRMRHHVPEADSLVALYHGYDELRTNASLREKYQLALTPLKADSNALLAEHVFGTPLAKPRYSVLILLQCLLSAGTLLAVLASAVTVQTWLAVVTANALITFVLLPRLRRNVEVLISCNQLLGVAESLAAIAPLATRVPHLLRLAAERPERRPARRAFRWFWMTRLNLITETIASWLNLLFLTDFVAYIRNIDRFASLRPVIASTFDLVGSVDADIAVASFLERCPDHCQPGFSQRALIDVDRAWHPLLSAPVKASVRLEEQSALITGSNMAGKTTFIKTVGVNIILGRALGFCMADRAVLPESGVMASIRGEHSVESGKSHYFAEIEAIKSFFTSAQSGLCKVFLIDELFSGTNTVERLAAARAVLETLSQHAQVLVTTHDVELQDSLAGRFALYHFLENPDIEGYFDYQLRGGATVERNAIRLLARLGFPQEVLDKALTYSKPANA